MLFFISAIALAHLAWMKLLTFLKSSFTLRLVNALALVYVLACMASIPLFSQSIALVLLVAICQRVAPRRPVVFAVASLGAVAVIFGCAIWHAASHQAGLIERFPLESMADRVPAPRVSKPHRQLAGTEQWNDFESMLASQIEAENAEFWSRSRRLRKLHEDTMQNFVNSPGFGVTRMARPSLTPEWLDQEINAVEPIEQPAIVGPIPLSTANLEQPNAETQIASLRRLHFGGLADFINLKGFGYAKDRDHVAGFRSHQFSKMPDEHGAARVQRLELVSLLMHETPVVYVSKQLPRMRELKHAATRTLSEFEASGLDALANGEDFFVRDSPEGLLMLGAIRSVNQCIQCHGGERGDLLGAFSYNLARAR